MTKIPKTDSIEELARFWDSHDLTDFEEELVEVEEQVFDGKPHRVLRVSLEPDQAAALHQLAEARGVEDSALVQEWVNERLPQ